MTQRLGSLRFRLFTSIWLTAVLSFVAVGVFFRGWAQSEIERLEEPSRVPTGIEALRPIAHALATEWPTQPPEARRLLLRTYFDSTSALDGFDGLLLAEDGAIMSAASEALANATVTLRGPDEFEVQLRTGRGTEALFRLTGGLRTSIGGAATARLFAWPRDTQRGTRTPRDALLGASTTLWAALFIAAVFAGLASFLVVRPMIVRLADLRRAAHQLARGTATTYSGSDCRDELADLENAFMDLAKALQSSEQARTQLVTDVAHELRTPLTNVIALLESVRDGLQPATPTLLDSIHEEAMLLRDLTQELQLAALAESRGLDLQPDQVDLRDVVRAAARMASATSPRVEVLAHLPADPVLSWADSRLVARILRNLVANALQHTPAGGTVSLSCDATASAARLQVSDTGTGIASEELERIWHRFHRIDPSRSRESGGMGLGLAIVRHLAEAMGGSTAVQSELGRGSTFTVSLPRHRDAQAAPSATTRVDPTRIAPARSAAAPAT